jgi:anaerobic selenocysteine-containing dehydrogenase
MNSQTDEYCTSACNLCFVNCGIKVQLGGEDGRQIVKVRGDEDHPTSKGYICNKAARINYYQNNPSRLHSPLRRKPDGFYE